MLELEHGFRIVDVHAHLDADAVAVEIHGRDVTPERLERECHQAGVVRSVVSPSPQPRDKGYLRANNAVARLSVDRPFLAFARLSGPRYPRTGTASILRNTITTKKDHHTNPADVEQYAYDDRFHGFVLDPVYDGVPTQAVLETLSTVRAPVLAYARPGCPPSAIVDALLPTSYPVIITGFGGFPLDRSRMEQSIDLLGEFDSLHLDTWFVRYRDILKRGLIEHPDRILFASGAPETHQNVAVMEILTLDVPEDAMNRVFNKNPSRVIPGLAPGGG